MDPVIEGNHGKNSKTRVARNLCLSSLAKFVYTVGKKSIRALEIFRVQKLILNATS